MSKLKLLHGISRIRRAKLQTTIDQAIADDIDLLAEWSNNESQYVVNELLRFALAQEEDFQKYKATASTASSKSSGASKSIPVSTKSGGDIATQSDPPVGTATARA